MKKIDCSFRFIEIIEELDYYWILFNNKNYYYLVLILLIIILTMIKYRYDYINNIQSNIYIIYNIQYPI